jgi:hypothetical protein
VVNQQTIRYYTPHNKRRKSATEQAPRAFGPTTSVVGPDRYTTTHTKTRPTLQHKFPAHRKSYQQYLFSTHHQGIEISIYAYVRLQFLGARSRNSFDGDNTFDNSNPFDSDNATARPAHTSVFWSSSPIVTSTPVRIIPMGQETDTTSNNRVQILAAIETKPRNPRNWTLLTLVAPVSLPQPYSECPRYLPR